MHACRGAEGAELTKTLPVIYFTDARSTGSVTIVFHAATESAHNLANRQLHIYPVHVIQSQLCNNKQIHEAYETHGDRK